jgi:hypothetical protein
LEEALASYEAALEYERRRPNYHTHAYVDFVHLVVEAAIESKYAAALTILDVHTDLAVFPIDVYRANGLRAQLLDRLGKTQEARGAARTAIEAAARTQSGFSYHQTLGLVQTVDSEFHRRVSALAADTNS